MNCSVTIDWKFALAVIGGIGGIGLLWKLSADAIERLSIHAVDAVKEYALVVNNER